jgi:hypothetical protein
MLALALVVMSFPTGALATEDNEHHNDDNHTPSCTITASPTSIISGNSTTLTLHLTNASTGTVDHGVGALSNNGTAVVSPTATTTYTATVTVQHEGGDDEDQDEDNDDNDDDDSAPQTVTCSVEVGVSTPVAPPVVVTNSCVAPSTLDQSGQRTIGVSPDGAGSQLQEITNAAGYTVTVGTDQTNDQAWTGTNNTVHFSAKFLAKFAGDKHVFGYFQNGTTTFTPVFKDDASIGGAYASVPVNGTQTFDLTNVSDVVFAIVDVSSGKTYATKTSLNTDSNQHAVVYNPSANTYAIGFEDLELGDHDYNDLVVEVKVTGCENPNQITIVATKIVCDNESDLPDAMGGSHTTDANTAANFLANHPSCHLAKDWQFEWGNQSAADAGRDFVGHATGYTTSGATAANGTVSINVPLAGVTEVHVRELLKDGFIPFTYDSTHTSDADTVSAELSCSNDGLHYDNFDFIRNPVAGNTYYCVAWNAPKAHAPVCNPEINLVQNGGFEAPDVATNSYDIVPDSNPLLKWLVAWTSPQDGGRLGLEIQDHVAGDPAGGAQHAELDGDHPVTISQQLATVPGQSYTINFKYSPRAGRNAADNTIKVKVDGSVLGADLAVDGTANGNTVWLPYTRTFVADSASTLLEFADTGTDTSYGGYLDDVSVSCVADETPTCPEGQHFNVDHICVPDVQECSVDAVTTLLSGDQGEGELITAALGNGAAKLVASPNGAWFAPGIGDGKWIWKDTFTSNTDAQNPTSQTFERNFQITGTPLDATLTIAADNTYDVKVNGHQECSNLTEFNYGATVNCTIPAADMVTGWNSLDITVTNKPIEGSTGANNPAGLSYKLVTHDNQCSVPENPTTGTLVIVKETTGGDGSFDFDVTGNDSSTDADVDTTEGSGSTQVSLPAGEYNVTETGASGWTLNSVSCVYDEESIGNSIPNGEAISLKAGDTVTCTFHNTKNDDSTPTPTSGTTGSGHGKKKSSGEVLGASTCSPLLTDYLKFGWKNNEDQVKKLQQFLNDHLGISLPISGFFGPATFNAVKQFQTKYGNDVLIPWVGLPASGISGQNTPTGYVYQTTRWKINNIWCPGSESFPTVLN